MRILLSVFLTVFILGFNHADAAVLKTNADDGDACSASAPMMTSGSSCRATPSQYTVTIYEMGVCTSDPFNAGTNTAMDNSSCNTVFENSSGFTNDYGASIGTSVEMEGTSSRPEAGTYKYPYMVMGITFVVDGSFTSNSVTYYSDGSGGVTTTSGSAASYTDNLLNFGGPKCVSGYMDAPISGVGTISAFLTNASLTRPDEDDRTLSSGNYVCTNTTRLVGVMNLDNPFTITEDTIGFQYNFILTDYGIQFFDDSSPNNIPDGFGSGPFSGSFTITNR